MTEFALPTFCDLSKNILGSQTVVVAQLEERGCYVDV